MLLWVYDIANPARPDVWTCPTSVWRRSIFVILIHYCDVTWTSCRLKSLVIRLFVQQRMQIPIKVRITGPLWGEFTGDREFLAQGASNAEKLLFDDVIMWFALCCLGRDMVQIKFTHVFFRVTSLPVTQGQQYQFMKQWYALYVLLCPCCLGVPALVLIMSWRRTGAKPLSEPMMAPRGEPTQMNVWKFSRESTNNRLCSHNHTKQNIVYILCDAY